MPRPLKKVARKPNVASKPIARAESGPGAGRAGTTSPEMAARIALMKQLIRETVEDPDDKPPTVDELKRAHVAELEAKDGKAPRRQGRKR